MQGGRSISYHYDTLNRLTGIQMGSQAFSYGYLQASPQVSSLTRAKGAVTTYQYDALNRLLEISSEDSSSAVINRFSYAYNEEDLRSSELRTNAGAAGTFQNTFTTYDYNQLNQLLGSTDPNQLFAYDYDGNMVQGYTPEGHPFAATYDAENRLSSLQYTDSSNTIHKSEYSYTGTGALALVRKFENDILVHETRYIRSGSLALQERDGNNSVKREYTWGVAIAGGIGGLLNLRQDPQDYFYLYDGRGNVTALMDSFQTIAATYTYTYTYDAFGNILSKTGTLDQPYRFSTKEYNEQTGLSYYGYRFYAPALGRWITRDPLEEDGGINLYVVTLNDPVNLIDPVGLRPLSDCEKDKLRPYFPEEALTNTDLHTSGVPWYLADEYVGITRRNDIYFRPAVYDPCTPEGLALLGHELVHVGQYRQGMTWLKYLWSTRRGYNNSKYEKPAYALQEKIGNDLARRNIYFFSNYFVFEQWRRQNEPTLIAKLILSKDSYQSCRDGNDVEAARCVLLEGNQVSNIQLSLVRYDENVRSVVRLDISEATVAVSHKKASGQDTQ